VLQAQSVLDHIYVNKKLFLERFDVLTVVLMKTYVTLPRADFCTVTYVSEEIPVIIFRVDAVQAET
jgi:hypothetical protein